MEEAREEAVSDLPQDVNSQSLTFPEGPYTLPMELGPKKPIPIMVLGT